MTVVTISMKIWTKNRTARKGTNRKGRDMEHGYRFDRAVISDRARLAREARERLEKAAPDLLEACKLFAAARTNTELHAALASAEAAIAKAKKP